MITAQQQLLFLVENNDSTKKTIPMTLGGGQRSPSFSLTTIEYIFFIRLLRVAN